MVVASPAAGYFKVRASGSSDTWASVPLVKRSVLMGRVLAAGPTTLSVTIGGPLTEGAFAPTSGTGSYHVQFVSGSLEGLSFKVLNNTADGLFTLATGGENLTSHALGAIATGESGDIVRIRPFWTLADVFGAEAGALSIDATADFSGSSYVAADAVFLADQETLRVDALGREYAFVTNSGWRQRGETEIDAAGAELPPGSAFVVRRQRSAAAEMVLVGYVPTERFVLRLPALASDEVQDLAVALAQPTDRTLVNSGLFSNTPPFGALETSPDVLNLRDALLVFDSGRRGFALPPAQRLHVTDSGWFESDAAADGALVRAGAGYVLRLKGARPIRYWLQSASN